MNIKLNQRGMSSILFAMIFAVILTLLGIGFAYLVRQDQREVLDKTLSNQAQYAAETAINRKAYELMNTTTAVNDTGDCSNSLDISSTDFSASAKVTCIQATNIVDNIVKENLDTEPYINRLVPQSGNFSNITIKWEKDGKNQYGFTGALPIIDSNNVPILRLTIAKNSNVDTTTNTVYLVPDSNLSSVNTINISNVSNGQAYGVYCNSSICEAKINYTSDYAWVSLLAYGGIAKNVDISVSGAANNKLVGSQAIIDANARAQDVTKRVKARVALVSQTWNPGFAASANTMCKDFKVDGATNDSSASGAAVCP